MDAYKPWCCSDTGSILLKLWSAPLPGTLIKGIILIQLRDLECPLAKILLDLGGLLTWRALQDLPRQPVKNVDQQSNRLPRSPQPWINCCLVIQLRAVWVLIDQECTLTWWIVDLERLTQLAMAATQKCSLTCQPTAPHPATTLQMLPSDPIEGEWVLIVREIARTLLIVDLESHTWLAMTATQNCSTAA